MAEYRGEAWLEPAGGGRTRLIHPDPNVYPNAAGKALSVNVPIGAASTRAYCLMRRDQVEALKDNPGAHKIKLKATKISGDVPTKTREFAGLYFVRGMKVHAGGQPQQKDSVYLAEFADKRYFANRWTSTSLIANVRSWDGEKPDHRYIRETVKAVDTPWAWTEILGMLWESCGIFGSAPAWPGTMDSQPPPENLHLQGANPWHVLNELLLRQGYVLIPDPKKDSVFTVAELRGEQELSAKHAIKDSEPAGGPLQVAPSQAIVWFPKHYDHYGSEDDTGAKDNWLTEPGVPVVVPMVAAIQSMPGTSINLRGDIVALINEKREVENEDALRDRAHVIANSWGKQNAGDSDNRRHIIEDGIFNDTLEPGPALQRVVWRNYGDADGLVTEAVQSPGMLWESDVAHNGVGGGGSKFTDLDPAQDHWRPHDLGRPTWPNYPRLPNIVKITAGKKRTPSSGDPSVYEDDTPGGSTTYPEGYEVDSNANPITTADADDTGDGGDAGAGDGGDAGAGADDVVDVGNAPDGTLLEPFEKSIWGGEVYRYDPDKQELEKRERCFIWLEDVEKVKAGTHVLARLSGHHVYKKDRLPLYVATNVGSTGGSSTTGGGNLDLEAICNDGGGMQFLWEAVSKILVRRDSALTLRKAIAGETESGNDPDDPPNPPGDNVDPDDPPNPPGGGGGGGGGAPPAADTPAGPDYIDGSVHDGVGGIVCTLDPNPTFPDSGLGYDNECLKPADPVPPGTDPDDDPAEAGNADLGHPMLDFVSPEGHPEGERGNWILSHPGQEFDRNNGPGDVGDPVEGDAARTGPPGSAKWHGTLKLRGGAHLGIDTVDDQNIGHGFLTLNNGVCDGRWGFFPSDNKQSWVQPLLPPIPGSQLIASRVQTDEDTGDSCVLLDWTQPTGDYDYAHGHTAEPYYVVADVALVGSCGCTLTVSKGYVYTWPPKLFAGAADGTYAYPYGANFYEACYYDDVPPHDPCNDYGYQANTRISPRSCGNKADE